MFKIRKPIIFDRVIYHIHVSKESIECRYKPKIDSMQGIQMVSKIFNPTFCFQHIPDNILLNIPEIILIANPSKKADL